MTHSVFGLKRGAYILPVLLLTFFVSVAHASTVTDTSGAREELYNSRALIPPLEIFPHYSDVLGANVTEVVLHVRLRQLTVPLWLEDKNDFHGGAGEWGASLPSSPSHLFSYTGRVYELGGEAGERVAEAEGMNPHTLKTSPHLRAFVPGPTLRVSPGGYIRMKLINELEDLPTDKPSSPSRIMRSAENTLSESGGGDNPFNTAVGLINGTVKNNNNTTMTTDTRPTTTSTTTTTTTTTSSPVVTWPFPVSMFYTMHHPNVTNMHFHGLHCDPHIDDPFVSIPPRRIPNRGSSPNTDNEEEKDEQASSRSHRAGQDTAAESSFHEYLVPIPEDHVPGLHWYHAHSHGSVYFQIMGGLFGALVVEQRDAGASETKGGIKHAQGQGGSKSQHHNDIGGSSAGLARRPWLSEDEVASHLLVFHLYRVGPGAGIEMCDGQTMSDLDAMIGNDNTPSLPTMTRVREGKATVSDREEEEEEETAAAAVEKGASTDTEKSSSTSMKRIPANLFLVNGQHRPTVTIQEDQPTTLRMLYAAGSCFLNLTFPSAVTTPSSTYPAGISYRGSHYNNHDDNNNDDDDDDDDDNWNTPLRHQCTLLPAATDGIPLDLVPNGGEQVLNTENHHNMAAPSLFPINFPLSHNVGLHPVTPATVAPTSWLYFTPATRYEVLIMCSRITGSSGDSTTGKMNDGSHRYPVRNQAGEVVFYLEVTSSSSNVTSPKVSSEEVQRESLAPPPTEATTPHEEMTKHVKNYPREEGEHPQREGKPQKHPRQERTPPTSDNPIPPEASSPLAKPYAHGRRDASVSTVSLTPEQVHIRQTAQLRELLLPYISEPQSAGSHTTSGGGKASSGGHRDAVGKNHGGSGKRRFTIDPPEYLTTPPRSTKRKRTDEEISVKPKHHGNYYNRTIAAAERPFFHWDISLSQRAVLESREFMMSHVRPYYVLGEGANCASDASHAHTLTGQPGGRNTPPPRPDSSSCYFHPFEGPRGESNLSQYHGFVVPFNEVVEAHIIGDPTDRMLHPFHFHVNHFQFISFTPRPGGLHERYKDNLRDFGLWPGQWRDTIPVLDGEMVVRWRAASFSGEIVYHCHMLSHEDRGMMTSYYVMPPQPAEEDGNASGSQGKEHSSKTRSWRDTFTLWKRYILSHIASITLGTILFVVFIVVVVFLPPFLIWWLCCRWNTFGGGADFQHDASLRVPLRRQHASSHHSHYGSTGGNPSYGLP